MRIIWYHPVAGYNKQIDSDKPDLLSRWLEELVVKYHDVLTDPSMPPVQLTFNPSGEWDTRFWSRPRELNVPALEWLVQALERIDLGLAPNGGPR